MNGRLEVDQKIYATVEEKLKDLPQFMLGWYYTLRASEASATTCRDYICKIKNYLEYLNGNENVLDVDLSMISSESIAKYLTHIQTKVVIHDGITTTVKTSDSYRQGVWSSLNNLCKYLSQNGMIKYNYAENIKRPKNNDLARINESRVLLTEEDFNKLLSAVNNGYKGQRVIGKRLQSRDLLIMMLLITTGMRKTALSEINIKDINFDDRTLVVIDKREIQHVYTISNKTMVALNNWLKDRKYIKNQTDALFITSNGNRMIGTEIYKIIDKYSKEALGYHISPHKIRAGFCSVIYEKTKDIEFTRRTVGHSNIETTKRYIVTKNNEREKSSQMIDDLISF